MLILTRGTKRQNKVLYTSRILLIFLRQDLFHAFVNGIELEIADEVDDKGFKIVHSYFEQDNSDIVVISRPYCDRLFFIKEQVYVENKART